MSLKYPHISFTKTSGFVVGLPSTATTSSLLRFSIIPIHAPNPQQKHSHLTFSRAGLTFNL